MTTGAAACSYPERTQRQGQLVVQNHQVAFRVGLELMNQSLYREAAEIHVRLGLGQNYFPTCHADGCRRCLTTAIHNLHAVIVGDAIYSKKTRIVRRELIFDSRIAETDDQKHAAITTFVSQALLLG